jgi:SAM-dependent methyltransferase
MGQYQTFPGAVGSSRTLEKLEALRLPSLAGKRFLDVGCNEGFFCGYASWDGAARSVGIDQNAASIEKAKQRFPKCDFLNRSWEELPAGPFDVILLASALHYAKDQPALVNALMGRLAPDGLLVLEIGLHPAPARKWVRVKRGIDKRLFPTMAKVHEMLRHHAWKIVGDSVAQSGDPIPRIVVHVRRRRPIAYLLMEPSGYGKSTIARGVFQPAAVQLVGADRLIEWISQGRIRASTALTAAVQQQDYHRSRIDVVVRRIFENGLLDDYVELVVQHAGTGDFVLDGYVPAEHHKAVIRRLTDKGYMPVHLAWEGVGAPAMASADIEERARAYFTHLGGTPPSPTRKLMPFKGARVLTDEVTVQNDVLTVRGWALNAKGLAPSLLVLDVAGKRHVFERYDRHPRPDVKKHYSLAHANCGYVLSVPLEQPANAEQLEGKISLYAGDSLGELSGPFTK